jgi:hypothetical protein
MEPSYVVYLLLLSFYLCIQIKFATGQYPENWDVVSSPVGTPLDHILRFKAHSLDHAFRAKPVP